VKLDPVALKGALAAVPPRPLPLGNLCQAAVLIPLFEREGEAWLLLTRRTSAMEHHGGEISFPGGRRDPGDPDLLATALRETNEEMGISPADVVVFGQLDDFLSIHNYRVTPFAGSFAAPYAYRADPREIAEVIELPLAAFLAPGVWHQESWTHQGRLHPVDFFHVGGQVVWGLTAAILRQFLRRAGLFPG